MTVVEKVNGIPEKIGPYGIREELGRGGMGIVYLARDSKLDRSVAIKVLSDSFAHDPERLARFEREARVLASLSHPNIAGIHGLEDDGGRRFLTLEYVEGETLAERLDRGPLSLEDTLEACAQIAGALEAAHESGVVHRDLKPSNVKIKPNGEIKVLDFGLAKEMVPQSSNDDIDASPTITYAPTAIGVILGTAAYMSPEQARGRTVDRRTDIWAFGCVLFECLTGRQAFAGETTSDTIARILVQEPDWAALPASTPDLLRGLIHRCLEKDPKRRLRDIGDARLTLDDVRSGKTSGALGAATMNLAVPARAVDRRTLALGIAAGCLVGAGLGFAAWKAIAGGAAANHERPVARYSVVLPSDVRYRSFMMTPDGSTFVFTGKPKRQPGGKEEPARIYVRSAGSYEVKAIPGTEGVSGYAVPSVDSRSLLFVAPATAEASKKKLYRAPLDGSSPPIAIADWSDSWSTMAELVNGDVLVLAQMGKSFVRIPAKGGVPSAPVKIDAGGYSGRFETTCHGAISQHGLLMCGIAYGPRGWLISVVVLDPETGKARVLVDEGGSPNYASTGHLLFTRADVLHAVPFDLQKLEVKGEPVAILSGVRTVGAFVPGSFELASNGTLLYAPDGRVGEQRRLMLVDRDGNTTPLTDERKAWLGVVNLSRTGGKVAAMATNESGLDEIWVHEPGRTAMRKVVSLPADCDYPVWSPDGNRIAFTRTARDADDGIYVQDLAGGAPRRVYDPGTHDVDVMPWSWSPDGKELLIHDYKAGTSDISALPMTSDGRAAGKIHPLLATASMEWQPAYSPDGRWIAYTSDETGKFQIYLAPRRPDGSLGTGVALCRGVYPRWAGIDRIVYFDETADKGMAIRIRTSPGISASEPEVVVEHGAQRINGFGAGVDGRVIIIQRSPEEDEMGRYQVALDWIGELKAKMRKPTS
jgi:eukaryotic-like serine/threonine-protein kinase